MMKERKTFELVELDGRKFIINMFPAAESLAILKELTTKVIPYDLFGDDVKIGKMIKAIGLSSAKTSMTIDEFVALENRLLKNVSERLPQGDEPILNSNGQFRVDGIENNLSLFLDLLMKVISVNYKDFFIEKLKKVGLINEKEE